MGSKKPLDKKYGQVQSDLLDYLVAIKLARRELELGKSDEAVSRLRSLDRWIRERIRDRRTAQEVKEVLISLREFVLCAVGLELAGSRKSHRVLGYIEESLSAVLGAWDGSVPIQNVQSSLDSISVRYWESTGGNEAK
ncbi:MAG: hypothetical protein M1357_01370 [Candidatus Marsarchaeota archaeon]|nr:hypothetical protein [Candidatus Marsarchaeota archaeon]